MGLVYLPFIINEIIESHPQGTAEWKQRLLFLAVTLCQICQLVCVRVLSRAALDVAHELIVMYCSVFKQTLPDHCVPNMVRKS